MVETDKQKKGISGSVVLAAGAGVVLAGLGLYYATRKTNILGTVAFTHKGAGMTVWAGFGISQGKDSITGRHNPMVWEGHQVVPCSNAWPDVKAYTIKIKQQVPEGLEGGKYNVFSFVHSAAGPVDMDPDQSMGDLMEEPLGDLGFIWRLNPNNWWQYFIDKPSSYILGRWYDDAIEINQPLLKI